ncbi:Uncharacterised protein [Mycobacteroides abscessus subsp. abscessus]|nr:Uncharacterised protein [Mycobacteroides abscessus subsp. abscessus]
MTDRADRGQTGWICGYRQRVAGIFIDCRVAVGGDRKNPGVDSQRETGCNCAWRCGDLSDIAVAGNYLATV